MASGDWRRKATGFRAESPEFAGQRLGRASLTRRNVDSSREAGNRIGETALAGWRRSPYRTSLCAKFPANREKYREICEAHPFAAWGTAEKSREFAHFRRDSLHIGIGNFGSENRENNFENREFVHDSDAQHKLAVSFDCLLPRAVTGA